ncbi:hypothetical protein JTB14_031750 [Gonioctena quinquepunctata]|nr:hypothetical protein JTB14_031750 [Gonioctena quinquepunctata]
MVHTRNPEDNQKYIEARRNSKKIISQAFKEFNSEAEKNISNNSGLLWNYVGDMEKDKRVVCFRRKEGNILNDDIVPEEFEKLFNSVYSNVPSRYLLNGITDQVIITDEILHRNVISDLKNAVKN